MATDREKEREAELESAMYTNCLLLGLDPAVLGMSGSSSGGPRVGHFRHSNPRMGEQLLYFLLCALRGPVQSAKDFDKVWPIFDSAQSRDFRKIVQGIISELESQGALPRSNSRVSSLATCCGPRFVELLWQLSVHALREVHRRTFAADVASNPLPASLTDVSYLHAASLLPVTKARIALERRKFLKNASTAVQRQSTWSNLANEMTAEFRGLCAEEAYLQQELEKLQDLRNKAKPDGELWDDRVSSSLGQTTHLVSKASRLWESLLSRKSQHEVLASGPIEDLIAHREHRYRISGSSLLAAMDLNSNAPYSDTLSVQHDNLSMQIRELEQAEPSHFQGNNETLSLVDDRNIQPSVDIAEVLRRWTHALQRIHKQSLHLVKANDGRGPELLRSSDGDSCHIESLATTLAEHRQHLISIQGLINQLKEAVPAMQQSISELTQEVNSMSSMLPVNEYCGRSSSPIQAQTSGRGLEHITDEVVELSSKLSATQLDRSVTSPALKLPHLFSVTPNSSVKWGHTPKRHGTTSQINKVGTPPEGKQVISDDHADNAEQGDIQYIQNLKRSVREAALSRSSTNLEESQERSTGDNSEHFFIPLPSSGVSLWQTDGLPNEQKQHLIFSPLETHDPNTRTIHPSKHRDENRSGGILDSSNESHVPDDHISMMNRQHFPTVDVNNSNTTPAAESALYDIDEALDQVPSSPLLLDSSFFSDTYEDLLAPLSETDAALMER